MKYIIGSRGCGATTQLLMESARFNIPILSYRHPFVYEKLAKNMGLEIPSPISLYDLKQGNLQGKEIDKILVDNAGCVLQCLLQDIGLNTEIVTSVITLD